MCLFKRKTTTISKNQIGKYLHKYIYIYIKIGSKDSMKPKNSNFTSKMNNSSRCLIVVILIKNLMKIAAPLDIFLGFL